VLKDRKKKEKEGKRRAKRGRILSL